MSTPYSGISNIDEISEIPQYYAMPLMYFGTPLVGGVSNLSKIQQLQKIKRLLGEPIEYLKRNDIKLFRKFDPKEVDFKRKYYTRYGADKYYQDNYPENINPKGYREPYNVLNNNQYRKEWRKYTKDNLTGDYVEMTNYPDVYFSDNNEGKDYLHNLQELPYVKDQLKDAKYAFSTTYKYKDEPYKIYDHFSNTNNKNLFDYIIEVTKDTDGKTIHHNYKMMKNITRGDKP